MIRKARKVVEYLSLLFLILVPFLSYVNTFREAYGKNGFHIANLSGGWVIGKLFALYEISLGRLDDPVSIIDSVKGTFWSITILGVNISDPLAGLAHILATREIYLPLLVSLSIPVIFTVVFGRAFCSWICPVNTVLEAVDSARESLMKYFPRLKDVNMGHGTKYWVLFITIILIATTGIPLFAYYLPYIVFGREVYSLIFFHTLSVGAFFLFFLVMMELFVSRRGWCRYLCPSGATLSMVGNFSMLRLDKAAETTCRETCWNCQDVCPMGLEVKEGYPGKECTQCGECILACSEDGLGFGFKIRRGAAYCLLAIILFLFFYSVAPADAHHMAGLPHYGYAENYPQIPLTEQKKESGSYVISFTTVFFQGINQELSNIPFDTQFFVHIHDKSAENALPAGFQNPFDADTDKKTESKKMKDASYRGKIGITILHRNKKEVTTYSLESPSEESMYRFRHYFASPGSYRIRVTFFPDGVKIEKEFPVSIRVAAGFPWLISIGVLAIAGFCIVLYQRKRRMEAPVLAG